MQNRIEQEITISADLDRVWELVTRPGWWVPSEVEVPPDRTPGSLTVRSSEKWGRFVVEVVELRPKTYAAFRWASEFPGEEPGPGKATLVEFFVHPADQEGRKGREGAEGAEGGVSVTVVESGFAALDLPEGRRAAALEDNTGGWREELARLRRQALRPPAS